MFSSIININILVTFACISLFFKVNLMLQILWHISSLFFRSVYSFKNFFYNLWNYCQVWCGRKCTFLKRNVSVWCCLKSRGKWPIVAGSVCAVHHTFIYQQDISITSIAGPFLKDMHCSFFQDFLCMSKSFWDQVFAFLYLSLSLGLAGTFRPPSLTFFISYYLYLLYLRNTFCCLPRPFSFDPHQQEVCLQCSCYSYLFKLHLIWVDSISV